MPSYAIPPDTRSVGDGNPPQDIDQAADVLGLLTCVLAGFAGLPGSPDPAGNAANITAALGLRAANATGPGLQPSGVAATDTANVAALIALGVPVVLAPGAFTFSASWVPVPGTRITGAGRLLTTCTWQSGVAGVSAGGASQVDGVEISGITMSATGAHLFTGSFAARWYVHDCSLVQNSAGFSIWNATLSGSQTMVECRFERNSEYVYGATRTVPAWFLSGPGGSNQVNQCSWRDEVCFNQGSDTSQYWYHLQNTGSNQAGNLFGNCLFEHPFGGMIWLESATLCEISNCLGYDLTGATISNHLIQISKNSGGTASSRNKISGGPRNQSGATFAAAVGDIGLDANCTGTTIIAPGASGNLQLYLNGSKGVKLVGMPDGGFGIQDSATTAVAGGSAGSSPPAPVVTAGGGNESGHITFGTGTSPAAGAQAAVTFGTPFETTPEIMITPYNAASAALQLYPSAPGNTGFGVACGVAPAASQANTVYGFRWHAVAA